MNQSLKIIVFTSILLLLIGGIYFYGYDSYKAKAQQQASGNAFYGWAWSSNIGWISFNCEDLNICGQSDYRVSIDPSTGRLSGYAWSSNIGWINFAPVGSYPTNPQNSAIININTGNVSGWLRACSVFQSNCKGALKDNMERGGWDGWLKIYDASPNEAKIVNNQLIGWAWGGDVVGWLNFYNVKKGISVTPPTSTSTPPTLPSGPGQQKWIEIIPY
ncbi:MAG: hypothetical protein AAB464_01335 [Patescibacteria group bacterium]